MMIPRWQLLSFLLLLLSGPLSFAIAEEEAAVKPPVKPPPNVIIKDNKVYNNAVAGIRVTGHTPVFIKKNEIHNNGRSGVNLDKRTQVTITDSKIYANKRGGVNIEHSSLVILKDNDIFNNERGGIRIQKTVIAPLPKAKSPDWDALVVHLHRNKIFRNKEGGLRAMPRPEARVELLMVDNQLFQNSQAGIRVENNTHLIARNNVVRHNGTAGIIAHESVIPPILDIVHNTIKFNGGAGIHIYAAVSGKMGIRNNWIHNNQRSGVICALWNSPVNQQTNLMLINNTIVSNGQNGQGSGVRNDSPGRLFVQNNIIAFNYVSGIRSGQCEDHFHNMLFANGHAAPCCDDPDVAPFWVEKVQYSGCSGRGPGDKIVDPKFRNPDKYDFHLTTDSPARNAGFFSSTLDGQFNRDMGATGGPHALPPVPAQPVAKRKLVGLTHSP